MISQQERIYPWKYAAFGGLAFAVLLSLFSFGVFLLFDILFSPAKNVVTVSFNAANNYASMAALSYIIIFLFSLILGLFVFVRLLRTRVTYLFVVIQAVILWFLLFIVSIIPLINLMVQNPTEFPWVDVFLNWSFFFWQLNSLISWLISVSLTFGVLRAIRIL